MVENAEIERGIGARQLSAAAGSRPLTAAV